MLLKHDPYCLSFDHDGTTLGYIGVIFKLTLNGQGIGQAMIPKGHSQGLYRRAVKAKPLQLKILRSLNL